jgi:hypothetical protein
MRANPLAAILIVTLAAGSALAASAPKKEEIRLDHALRVGSTLVPAGVYRVELSADWNTATLLQGKQIVVVAPVRVGPAQVVYSGNAIHSRTEADGRDRLVKVVLADSKLAVDFAAELGETAASRAAGTTDSR